MRFNITNRALEHLRTLNPPFFAAAAASGLRGKLVACAAAGTDITSRWPEAAKELIGRGVAIQIRSEDLSTDDGQPIVMICVLDRYVEDTYAVIALVSLSRYLTHHERQGGTASWIRDSRGAAALRAELARSRLDCTTYGARIGVRADHVRAVAAGEAEPEQALLTACHDDLGIRYALWSAPHVQQFSARSGHAR